ncbi:MAG: hypothetical protein KUG78_09250 [Kangiellaceae bacterium]|nr:hypothetical protein [Kangiellaceae bacterium]
MYRNGYLVEQDTEEGDEWLRKAAKKGFKAALELMYQEKKMSDEDMENFELDSRQPIIGEGEEVLVITKDKYSLSDLVDFLNSQGYGSRKQTGSRIRGKGCGKGIGKCIVWKINTPLGRTEFNHLISQINAVQTAILVNSRPQ